MDKDFKGKLLTHAFCNHLHYSHSVFSSLTLKKKAKEKGRDAYKAEDWESAINYFTEAMNVNSDAPCLALRSSAYQKMGKLEEALADADKCTELDSSYARGHFRRACVFSAMKETELMLSALLGILPHRAVRQPAPTAIRPMRLPRPPTRDTHPPVSSALAA